MSTLKYISPDSEYLLEQSKKNVRFENMPPTVEDNDLSSEHSAEGSPNQRRLPTEEEKTLALSELWRIQRLSTNSNPRFDADRTKAEVRSWIEKCRSLNIDVDVSRLARFAIFLNLLQVVRYLVEHEAANLRRRDLQGRSAVFYAVAANDLLMWKYLATPPPGGYGLYDKDHRDLQSMTPLHWATSLWKDNSVEFLLAHGAATDFREKDGSQPESNFDGMTRSSRLLFAIQDLSRAYPDLEIQASYLPGPSPTGDEEGAIPSEKAQVQFERKQLHEVQRDLLAPLDAEFDPFLTNLKGSKLWLHLEETNAIAIYAVIRRIIRDIHRPNQNLDLKFGPVRSDFLHSLDTSSAALGDRDLDFLEPVYKSNLADAAQRRVPPFVKVVFPCLVIRSENCIGREEEGQARKRSLDARTAIGDNPVKRLIQLDRTLDEAYYPGLPATALAIRNADQVVNREWPGKISTDKGTKIARPILMVPNLWIWRLDNVVISAYSTTLDCHEGDSRAAWTSSYKKADTYMESGLLVGNIVAEHVFRFGKHQLSHQFPSPLDIFETSVNRILSDVDVYMNPNAKAKLDIGVEREFIRRLADLKEELAMIREVLTCQEEILQDLIRDYETNNPDSLEFMTYDQDKLDLPKEQMKEKYPTANFYEMRSKWRPVLSALAELAKYQKKVAKIDRDVERIEKTVQDQLDLKRTHVSIRDTHSSLILGVAVAGFTVITIIFTPLAFAASLFALPLDRLLKNQFQFSGTDGTSGTDASAAYTSHYVGTWFAVTEIVSLVVTALLVVLFLWAFGGEEFLYELVGYCPKPAKQAARAGGSRPVQPPVMVTPIAKATEKDFTVQTEPDLKDSSIRRRVVALFGGAKAREVHPA